MSRRGRLLRIGVGLAVLGLLAGLFAWRELTAVRPAGSVRLAAWDRQHSDREARGGALLAYGDFGAVDLDTLKTSALPWPILAASLALHEADGRADVVSWDDVRTAFRRFGFLYPETAAGVPGGVPEEEVPLGLSLGTITRAFPPLKLQAINTGCSACHAGPAYGADGTPDLATAIPGMPNTSLDLEAFSSVTYAALKAAFRDELALNNAIGRLFPAMDLRERLTLRLVALPAARKTLRQREATYDRAMPFSNGAPGLTNGVAALKHQLGVTPPDTFQPGAGFVSVPVLADRFFRSALLVDGAYAPKGAQRWHPVSRAEADKVEPGTLAAITSFFMVPSMGMTDARSAAAIGDLTDVLAYLKDWRPPRFPGPVDRVLAEKGRAVYAGACASCHGTYDDSLDEPRLLSFPNWSGDVGTDRSRVDAFSPELVSAVSKTLHGRDFIDAAATGVTAAPPLAGLWASAPYFVNGSVPTIRHLLEPATRPARFMVGGHGLDMNRLGIAGVADTDGTWRYPEGYVPFSSPVTIDATAPGFSNRGHEAQVQGLDIEDRDALIEYLKLL